VAHCEHYEICGRDAVKGVEENLCVLHSENPGKDKKAFNEALDEHRNEKGTDFSRFVFPGDVDFKGTEFTNWVSLFHAKFTQRADFSDAKFLKGVNFRGAKFSEEARFFNVTFIRDTNFSEAEFSRRADFGVAKFRGRTSFARAAFSGYAFFDDAEFMMQAIFAKAKFETAAAFLAVTFAEGGDFSFATFSKGTQFFRARFMGRTLFVAEKQENSAIAVFSDIEADFREVAIAPPDVLIFRDADLQKCLFVGTDLRKAEFAGVKWPKIINKKWPKIIRKVWPTIVSRDGVFDEIEADEKGEPPAYPHIEQLYRQLKQNYEDRKDYGRAGDFHYGEKEMRRKNPETSRGLKCWLNLYRLVSGYGESWGLPLVWTAGLFAVTTFCYLWWGLLRLKDACTIVDCTRIWETGLYSLKVMILLKPSNFEPSGLGGDVINTLQSIFGPVLIGLFALAIRQKLKR
jgi:uncharacterized protein YjbI with pentapeptide repeats